MSKSPEKGGRGERSTFSKTAMVESGPKRQSDAPASEKKEKRTPAWKARHDEGLMDLVEDARRIIEHGPCGTDPQLVPTGEDLRVFEERWHNRTLSTDAMAQDSAGDRDGACHVD